MRLHNSLVSTVSFIVETPVCLSTWRVFFFFFLLSYDLWLPSSVQTAAWGFAFRSTVTKPGLTASTAYSALWVTCTPRCTPTLLCYPMLLIGARVPHAPNPSLGGVTKPLSANAPRHSPTFSVWEFQIVHTLRWKSGLPSCLSAGA